MDKNTHQSNVAPAPTSSWWLPMVLEREHGLMPPPAPKPQPPENRTCSGALGRCRGALRDRSRALSDSVAAM